MACERGQSIHDEFERNQWAAWSAYMSAWSSRTNFQAEWANSRKEFDPNFASYIDGLMRGSGRTAATDPVGSKTP